VAFLLVRCLGTLPSSTVQIVKSESAKNKAQSLKRTTPIISGDSSKYTRYYIYRNGSFVGSALSSIIYDNNEYVALAKVQTFEKVDYVIPGEHIFTSQIDAKQNVKFQLDSGKTYIIQALASTSVREGVLLLMNHDMIKKELDKGNFFNKKFLEAGLKVEDISY
jgi:hypothetical protein